MEYIQAFLSDNFWWLHISAALLGLIRIVTFIGVCPLFGPSVSAAVKGSIAIALYIPLHPLMLEQAAAIHLVSVGDFISLLIIVVKEVFIGIFLGWLTSLVFYAVLSAGTIVDNQRGASMAQTSDMLSGAETSPLGSILFMSLITLFFVSGSFTHFMELFYSSYVSWPVREIIPDFSDRRLALFSISNLTWMMKETVLVASPFILISLTCDISLGLINRFAQQLNVFILSMPIKSGVCSFLIIFYYPEFLENGEISFGVMLDTLKSLFTVFGKPL